jgi:hypothetical protein
MPRYFVAALVLTMAGAPPAIAQTASAQPKAVQTKAAQPKAAAPAKPAVPAAPQTETLNLTAYAELLRSDIRAEKVAILTEMMEFTEAEDTVFWPIYREYDNELAKLGDERVALISEYAKNYETLTDEVADRLATRALDLESRRQAVRAKYYARMRTALKPRTALRFLQVEHQLQLLIDLADLGGAADRPK